MKYKMKLSSPAYRQPLSTQMIMRDLLIGLCSIACYIVILQAITKGMSTALYSLCIILVSILSALCVEYIWGHVHQKDFKHVLNSSFPFITPIIFALLLPVTTPIYVVVIGSCFASFFGKLVYGGFGQNIFNPALVGRVIVHLSFANEIMVTNTIDGITSPTPVTALSNAHWFTQGYPYTLLDIIKGTYAGAMVESALIPVIIVALILYKRHVYDMRIPVSYILTVILLAVVSSLTMKVNTLDMVLYQLCLGGLAFGAFFMATDPVTSPTSPYGKIIYGICLGFLTILIRLKGNNPEGVMFSILMMNMIVPFIESVILGQTNKDEKKKVFILVGMLVIFSIIIGGIGLFIEPVLKAGVFL